MRNFAFLEKIRFSALLVNTIDIFNCIWYTKHTDIYFFTWRAK